MSTNTSVLIADDSLVVRAVVRSQLEEEGYDVTEAADGNAALAQCRLTPPDVVLLDVEMPGLTGHQVLAQLKADDALKDIPVVFLTGRTAMDDVLTALRGGAHDYLKKPFEAAELVARVGAAAHVKKLQDRLRERNGELERVSRTDMLTGLYNRRHLEEELRRHHSVARRNRAELGVILLDIDHFKNVNDTYGHAAGDEVLAEFAQRLPDQLRAGDIAGRWGGEEFLVILPDTGYDGTRQVAERICASTAATPMRADGRDITVTVSGGCAVDAAAGPDALVSLADMHMYQAKQSGRNRIVAQHDLAAADVAAATSPLAPPP
jgi:two-component system, cell cycle response regulator